MGEQRNFNYPSEKEIESMIAAERALDDRRDFIQWKMDNARTHEEHTRWGTELVIHACTAPVARR